MGRSRLLAALSVLIAALSVGCLGDPGYTMTYKNTTDLRLTVEVIDANPGSPVIRQIEPGGSGTSHWLYPSGSGDPRRALVRARDQSGAEIFCRKFSYDDAKGNFRWTIDIEFGVRQCD
jgi:hypothetical protein